MKTERRHTSVPKATHNPGEGRLWAASFLASLLINGLLFASLAQMASQTAARQAKILHETRPAEDRWVAAVIPDRADAGSASVATVQPSARLTPFARTSPAQASERPEAAKFTGERNTRAASDHPVEADAPPLPSQQGVDDQRDMETTESRYRDGELPGGDEAAPSGSVPPTPPGPSAVAGTEAKPPGETTETQGEASQTTPPPVPERLAEGPNPVDREVAAPKPAQAAKKTDAPPQLAAEGQSPEEQVSTEPQVKPETPAPVANPGAPGFNGNQRKTQIRGSISRQGVSALDVEDSPLGRYQATISRAVEREWQRNCVRYKDLIKPGYLSARFIVESTGKVRSVDFVEVAAGKEEKGLTLNSIREAEIPAMSAELKKQLGGEPLELLFNFYF